MKRILVTGASGFIGRHCLAPLRALEYEVHAVSRGPVSDNPGRVKWHQADLLDPSSIAPLISKVQPTHLLHLAWIVTPGESIRSMENFRWVQASFQLAEAFAAAGGRRMVVGGTCFEYDCRHGLLNENRTPLRPGTAYGACKHALHEMLTPFCQAKGIDLAWPRIFYLYGPHEHPRRLVASVIQSLLLGEPANCTPGRQVRDYLHVADVARALALLVDSDVTAALNIGSGMPVSLREIVECIGQLIGRKELLRLGALVARENEPPLIVADATRLKNQLHWQPKFSLEEGLRHTIDWWQAWRAGGVSPPKPLSTVQESPASVSD